jgi:hypothetical protein
MLLLGGCITASTPESGSWKIERSYDRIHGKPAGVAHVSARSRNERVRDLGLQLGWLQLTCFESAPVIRLEFNHRIGSNRTSVLSYRFDEHPGRDAKARFLATYNIAVIEDPTEVAQFVDQLRTSTRLHVRVVSHVAGTTTVEFPVKGASAAIDVAFQSCSAESAARPRSA